MTNFKEKSVIITGASTGIGRELAVRLAGRGASLVLAARDSDKLKAAVRDCAAAGGKAVAVETDVTDPESCRQLIETAAQTFGKIDILVNNAGISMWVRLEDVTDLSVFERVMKVNYLGAVYCTHYALPHLKASRGLAAAISSLAGLTGIPAHTGYSASKHAMQGFFDSLRMELLGAGVDVLVVSPGVVTTDIRARALGANGAPLESSPGEGGSSMTVEECATQIISAIESRRRDLVMTFEGKLGRWVKLIAPSLLDRFVVKAFDKMTQV